MRVLVAGASGLIGTELTRQLAAGGHEVVRLVRREPGGADEIRWDPAAHRLPVSAFDGVDAVVNLSGESLSRVPWTAARKRRILSSRIEATTTLAESMREAPRPPAVFVSGSAVGFYGSRPGVRLTEEVPRGTGFLADVTAAWEAAARLAPDGTRLVLARTGVVIGPGGAMKPLLPIAQAGLAGPIGSGRQHWPWISLHDEAAALVHLLGSELSGPVNLAGPTPATAGDVVGALAEALHRPYLLPLPSPAVKLALGQAGRELLLADQQEVPQKLTEDGFVFRDKTVRDAMARLIEARRR
ncbi:TIGR01777 family oxidoreductase [Leifsonia sp. AG29]|uniref:TIGR01777 family oxidoreductase n=1 Tax=Leifsonia sp. AG29 TaxID=2598860 RepID=UPI00131E7127|nr:TIGR01777 family oxidoreductase [Leifsonia sp. AG29]